MGGVRRPIDFHQPHGTNRATIFLGDETEIGPGGQTYRKPLPEGCCHECQNILSPTSLKKHSLPVLAYQIKISGNDGARMHDWPFQQQRKRQRRKHPNPGFINHHKFNILRFLLPMALIVFPVGRLPAKVCLLGAVS